MKGEEIDDPDVAEGELGYKIYVQERPCSTTATARRSVHYDMKPASKKLPKAKEDQLKVTKFMCDNFFDIRAFGAVATTDVNCGQVRGPSSCASPSPSTRCCRSDEHHAHGGDQREGRREGKTMGRKQYVPYGLYRAEGFISAALAEKTGFSQDDLDLFFEALMNMFENDRSAARGLMASRKLFAFKHESKLGNAPAHKLFDTVSVKRLIEDGAEARAFSDYEIVVDRAAIPEGVELLELPVE